MSKQSQIIDQCLMCQFYQKHWNVLCPSKWNHTSVPTDFFRNISRITGRATQQKLPLWKSVLTSLVWWILVDMHFWHSWTYHRLLIVDHDILLTHLFRSFRVRDDVLSWMSSYLSGRCYTVRFAGTESSSRRMQYGVPQGSVLGPLLFVLYTADLVGIVLYCIV